MEDAHRNGTFLNMVFRYSDNSLPLINSGIIHSRHFAPWTIDSRQILS